MAILLITPQQVVDLLNKTEYILANGKYNDIIIVEEYGNEPCKGKYKEYQCLQIHWTALYKYYKSYIILYNDVYYFRPNLDDSIELTFVSLYYRLLEELKSTNTLVFTINPNYVEI